MNDNFTDTISAALWFAKQGIRVFPLAPNSKIPGIKKWSWQENATLDGETILRWWAMSYVGYNLGVVTDSLIVTDVDTHHEAKHGPTTLAALIEEHGPLPRTFTVETASGGLHYFWDNPTEESVTKGADKLGPGLDIQTGQSYLVGPTSTTPQGEYRVIDDSPIAPIPSWMLEMIKDKPVAPIEIRRAQGSSQPPANRYVDKAVQGELDRLADCQRSGWGGPAWDSTTYEVACNLIEIANTENSGYSHSQAYSDFMGAAPTDEKFGPRQHEAKWKSAVRKVGNGSRVFPQPKYTDRPAQNDPKQAEPVEWRQFDADTTPQPPQSVSKPLAFTPPPPRTIDYEKYWPGDFYAKSEGLLVKKLAEIVKLDFGLGPDGELWLYENGIYKPDSIELMRRVTRLLGDRYRPAALSAVEDVVRSQPDLPRLTNALPDQRFIVLKNGVYEWATDTLHPHSPEYGAITQLPIIYDPDATSPVFDRYLSEVVPADTINLAWETLGYMHMFGNPLQKSVILQGPGGNGKSAFLRVIQKCLGMENISALSLRQITEDRFSMAGLLGKTANIAGDIDAKYLSDASRFKQLVGGDLIDAERKFGQPFQFEPFAVPIFSANDFWKTGDTSHGYFRRWLPIPFPYSVQNMRQPGDELIEAEMWAETSGIFNRAMVGLRTLMARGEFEESGSVAALKRQMESAADILSDWFTEDERITGNNPKDDTIRAPRSEAFRAFREWCAQSGHKGMSSSNFFKRMTQLGYGEATVHGIRYYYGIEVAVTHNSAPLPGF